MKAFLFLFLILTPIESIGCMVFGISFLTLKTKNYKGVVFFHSSVGE